MITTSGRSRLIAKESDPANHWLRQKCTPHICDWIWNKTFRTGRRSFPVPASWSASNYTESSTHDGMNHLHRLSTHWPEFISPSSCSDWIHSGKAMRGLVDLNPQLSPGPLVGFVQNRCENLGNPLWTDNHLYHSWSTVHTVILQAYHQPVRMYQNA